MWTKVFSGFGYWDVYSWIIFFFIASGLVLWIRSMGRSDYKKGTEQDEIFYGANAVPEDGSEIQVPASSAYWGFVEALKGYYEKLSEMHSGLTNDYVGYIVVVAAVLVVLVLL